MMMKKLWTIQHRDAYQLLMKKGVLRANEQLKRENPYGAVGICN